MKWLRCPLGIGLALHFECELFLRDRVRLLIVDSVWILDNVTNGAGVGQSLPECVPVQRVLQFPVLGVDGPDGRVTPEGRDCFLIADNGWKESTVSHIFTRSVHG